MTASAVMLLLAMVNAPQVEISTIEGVRYSGTLTSVDATSWEIDADNLRTGFCQPDKLGERLTNECGIS